MVKRQSTFSKRHTAAQDDKLPRRVLAFVSYLKPDKRLPKRVVLYARTSGSTRDQRAAIQVQLANLRRHAKRLRFRVIREVLDCGGNGRVVDRPKLQEAIGMARDRDAAVLARDLSRFIRSTDFTDDFAVPEDDQFDRLDALADGVRLCTRFDPRTPFQQTFSSALQEGRDAKVDPRSGSKKQKTQMIRSKAFWFRAAGLTYNDLWRMTGAPRSTCYRAFERLEKNRPTFLRDT